MISFIDWVENIVGERESGGYLRFLLFFDDLLKKITFPFGHKKDGLHGKEFLFILITLPL